MAQRIKLEKLADAILYHLYLGASESPPDSPTFPDIQERYFSKQVSIKLIELAAAMLKQREHVEFDGDSFLGDIRLDITYDGYNYVDGSLLMGDSFITRYASHGQRAFMYESGATSTLPLRLFPASDRLVQIDHNDPALSDTVEKIRIAIAETRKVNDRGDVDDAVLAELELSLVLLKYDCVDIDLLERMLFGSLKYLIQRFADSAVDMAASAALTAAATYFGLTLLK